MFDTACITAADLSRWSAENKKEVFTLLCYSLEISPNFLQKMEWNGDKVSYICPSCGAAREAGHDAGCALEIFLKAIGKEDEEC